MSGTFKPNLELTREIRDLALREGADLFGVASAESLSGAPKGFRPEDILPTSKVVIVVGKRLSDATVDSAPSRMFDTMYAAVNNFIDILEIKITNALMSGKNRAIAVGPSSMDGKLVMGDISMKHAAVAAGLGRFGLQSLVLTPKFGPRQRWGAIVTDASLEFGFPLEEVLCKPKECNQACVKNCPAEAFSERQTGEIKDSNFLPGGLWYYWHLDKQRCRAYRAKRQEELGWVTGVGHACAVCKKVCPLGHMS